jgi:hypothetical protein
MKLIRFLISLLFLIFGGLSLFACMQIKGQIYAVSGIQIITNISKYPKLFFGYLIAFICFISSLKSSIKASDSSVKLIKILAVIVAILSIAGIVYEIILIK